MKSLSKNLRNMTAIVAVAAIAAPSFAAADVTVGVLVPLTGELGEFGAIVAGAVEVGVNEINAAGGTSCGMMRTVVADTGGSAEKGIREANNMIDTEGAVAILGPTSGVMVALVDLAQRRQTPIISPYAGTITLNDLGGDYVYRTVGSDLGDGAAAGLWLAEKGYQSVAMLVQNEESTISPAQVARAALEEAGIEVTDYVIYNPGQPSYQAELISVLANNPDAIYLAGGQESGVTVLKEAAVGGFEGEWLLTADLAVPQVFETVDTRILNGRAYVELAEPDNSLPAYQAFAEKMMAETGKEPGPFAANSYDMAMLVALAIEGSADCSGEAINSAIRGVTEGGELVSDFATARDMIAAGTDIDFEGASGPLTMDESGTPAGSFLIMRAEDGAWVSEKFYPASSFE
ncbi:putative branched-chain-amino-acid ABC-transporter periplasmatic substrate-binding component [Octadecabacter arcticus 238]|jgi:branched-chain amino acid transport system substrate-binding protein|uniref:Putative branched-chain-amino-acid ABC-transporter periplasmatic substrate-binding component n=1 Tax=Octadecabacter arcticus 238 TaxID=391616 RepID=M9RFV0_9RHOB|nr:ABC transporter substrate-binding protein [Octadecabacter arcticus]AGI71047.1 putative branched-chain-amino-acid ABC-transporter periplasmatic substrate-binding component [Octadecabacter arcticus 238]